MLHKIYTAIKSPLFLANFLGITCVAFISMSKYVLADSYCREHYDGSQFRCVNHANTPEKRIRIKNISSKRVFFDVHKYQSTCGQNGTQYFNSPRQDKKPGEYVEYNLEGTGNNECRELFVINCVREGDKDNRCPEYLNIQVIN